VRDSAEAEEVCDRIASTGALEDARGEALEHVRAAKSLLDNVELDERQRRTLDLVADGVVDRYA
jgi:geranylgeranyl pyrophosphate synthase